MSSKPLVSLIIVSYRNYHYIYEALESILLQTYSNIEIIISNDESSDFNKQVLTKYLKKHCRKNIKRFVINNNKHNLGTVKNANIALKLSHGKYILLFAADDAIYDKYVVSKFVQSFESLPKNELIVTSQLGMYNENLTKMQKPFISNTNKGKINNLTPKELFCELTEKCMIASAGTCYKREIFEKYGYFDEKYVLVEDYSSSLKFSRLGIRHNYFDFISFKHRYGGISHGNNAGQLSTSKKFDLDILNIMKYEIVPYLKLLNDEQKKVFFSIYKDRKWRFTYKYKYELGTKKERRAFVKENFYILLFSFLKDIYKKIRKSAAYLVIIGIILYTMHTLNFNFGKGFTSIFNIKEPYLLANNINWYIGLISILIIIIGILFIIIPAIYKIIKKIYKFLKHIL